MTPSATEGGVREEMCRVGKSLFDRGYVHATAGNISVRLDDEAQLVGLRVGDRVDVVASSPDAESPARVVARGATIAVIPEAPDDRTAPSLGVVTPRAAALDLAASRLESRLGILVLS